ncbi:CueP family metal-binding protein [Ornithinimicrobium avium]|uniref:CueP family metal-binding protein n=1 Tax=Ornithinimicrobium avium TaxID=2283195 RepID=A0A345NJH4_9MICO|nr:CueP family metal-binding protein [Ornithinimicrobium avium]AXH95182.1 hypothetical protein DV701_02595 [Ornithinimicrobium avium]
MRAPLTISALGLALALALTGCSQPATEADGAAGAAPLASASSADVEALLAPFGLAGADGREVVDRLESDPGTRPLTVQASVREDHLVVGDGSTETALPLPDDLFYVSVAPYVRTTHDCFYHALGGCQGELPGEDVEVRITDGTGEVLVEQTVTTGANGFAGFWLPRGVQGGTVEMSAGGGTGSVPLSTTPGSPTCLTTLQLAPAR